MVRAAVGVGHQPHVEEARGHPHRLAGGEAGRGDLPAQMLRREVGPRREEAGGEGGQ